MSSKSQKAGSRTSRRRTKRRCSSRGSSSKSTRGLIPCVEYSETELTVKYLNGSKLTLYGADNPDSLRGIGLWAVVFDEYSQQPSNIFTEIIRPALADHLSRSLPFEPLRPFLDRPKQLRQRDAEGVFADSVPKVIVKVPFDFMVSNHILGAGDYSLNIDLSHSAVRINHEDGSSMFVLTYAAEATSVQRYAKLVFHRYGDRYFLSQVWVPGTTAGRELPPSKAEQEIARAHGKPELVALLAGGTKASRSAR